MFSRPTYEVSGPTLNNTYEVDVFIDDVHKGTVTMTSFEVDRFVEWTNGNVLIQNALPNHTADERELLMTGITAKEWDELFGPAEDDYENA